MTTSSAPANLPPISTRIAFLDGLRGLAAIYVMLGHARWLLWEGFSEGFALHPEQYSLPAKLLAYASISLYYGHQAVIFFFVLSGFVIHLRYLPTMDKSASQLNWLTYLKRRFRRIYPVFICALALTWLVDQAGIAQRFPIYFDQTPYQLINLNINPVYTPRVGLANLFMIPDTQAWGTNGPLWSLRIEWCFYLIYPILWMLRRKSLMLVTVILLALFGLSFMPQVWPINTLRIIFSAFPAWWMGALLAEAYVQRPSLLKRIALLTLLCSILPFLVQPLFYIMEPIQDFLWGLAFTGLLALCFTTEKRTRGLFKSYYWSWLGDISYTLYAIHFPIIVFISGWLMSRSPTAELPQGFHWIVIGAAICILAAYLVHWLVERPLSLRKPSMPISQ